MSHPKRLSHVTTKLWRLFIFDFYRLFICNCNFNEHFKFKLTSFCWKSPLSQIYKKNSNFVKKWRLSIFTIKHFYTKEIFFFEYFPSCVAIYQSFRRHRTTYIQHSTFSVVAVPFSRFTCNFLLLSTDKIKWKKKQTVRFLLSFCAMCIMR